VFGKSFKIAMGALLAGAALTACGPVKTGAAAVVGGDRITIAKLDGAVRQWARELPKYPAAQQIVQQSQAQGQGRQIPFDPSSPQRSALYQLVDMRVWDEVARRDGVRVAQGEVDAFVAQNGGTPTLDANVLAQGLPTRYDRDYARVVLLRQTLLKKYGVSADQPADPQAQQAGLQRLFASYAGAGHRLKVSINPRYGSFDFRQMALRPVCPGLSSPDSGTPSSSGEIKCQV
jgi:hypothetical protein